jgi:hypothetical protein
MQGRSRSTFQPQIWEGGRGACISTMEPVSAVHLLGRYKGYHRRSINRSLGDGTDRLAPGFATKATKNALKKRLASAKLVVAEGLSGVTLNRPFVRKAKRLGYDVRIRELDIPSSEADRRQKQRDGEGNNLQVSKINAAWFRKREQWVRKHSGYECISAEALLNEMNQLTSTPNASSSEAVTAVHPGIGHATCEAPARARGLLQLLRGAGTLVQDLSDVVDKAAVELAKVGKAGTRIKCASCRSSAQV